ncbi:hypothetical protein LEMLEM_LOCUS5566, partial [Lemmus lemmus]
MVVPYWNVDQDVEPSAPSPVCLLACHHTSRHDNNGQNL